jgi:hypothetical protein
VCVYRHRHGEGPSLDVGVLPFIDIACHRRPNQNPTQLEEGLTGAFETETDTTALILPIRSAVGQDMAEMTQ